MQFGIHIPQLGRKAGPEAIRRGACQAEDLGYDHIWVNDHLAVPHDAPYPPTASFYEPLITLTWAAAATSRVGLGTSVLLLPLRTPVHLAKELATLDLLSGGRLILGTGVGWLEGEFDAMGVPFAGRGARTEDIINILRACWNEDPISYEPTVVTAKLEGIRALPQPGRKIPVWVGGHSRLARRRAMALGDGWHGTRLSVEDSPAVVADLRAARGPDFAISLRLFWDPFEDDQDELKAMAEGYAKAGIDALVLEPRQRGLDDWLRAVEGLWTLLQPWHD
ncbi:MAG: TIGR03619 family F420-dependent LLM class oxidoreductase [Alphaproteobacteria bacterium]|jgi:probable F420-dependent oxidoreductase|nr:TIGR03619 family F420-dependent LLM class oxidoreductase [Alphaproteobacteria bacterium]